jgi:hypothetical protein
MDLATLGFKVVPLSPDGKGSVIPWKPIYDNGGWNLIELSKQYHLFENGIATCFGLTILPKSGLTYYLNGLDIDSQNVTEKLSNIIPDNHHHHKWAPNQQQQQQHYYSLIDKARQNTWVTKTRKGYHIYWLSHEPLSPIRPSDCTAGWEFEIKTDSSGGLATLPLSRHRNDSSFIYENIGQPYISVSDVLYYVVLRELEGKLVNKQKQQQQHWRRPAHSGGGSNNGSSTTPWQSITLTDGEIDEIAAVISAPNSRYMSGLRHQMSQGLSGFFCKDGIDFDSAKIIYDKVCDLTGDEEKRSRLADLKETYKRFEQGKQIVGYSLLRELSPYLADRLTKIMSEIRDKRRKNESA